VPALATVFTFQQLQSKTVAAGITRVPADRSPLKNLHTLATQDHPKCNRRQKIAAMDLRRPMCFTGHAFYDGFHKPSVGTTPGDSSRRISAWEIHPIYAIEVCINTSLSGCPRDDASRWRPLRVWLASDEDDG
jgi:hypothetical protein